MLEIFSRSGSINRSSTWLKCCHLETRLSCLPQRRRYGMKTVAVTDGDVARLAAKPLHPLTLADLVKYEHSTSFAVHN